MYEGIWLAMGFMRNPLAFCFLAVLVLAIVRFVAVDAPGIPKLFDLEVSDRPVLSVRILGQDIFAPTAAVIFQFREVAMHGRDTRVAHYDQPPFAWK